MLVLLINTTLAHIFGIKCKFSSRTITCVRINSKKELIALGYSNGQILIHSLKNGNLLHTLKGVYHVIFKLKQVWKRDKTFGVWRIRIYSLFILGPRRRKINYSMGRE
jgi:hypothetical protein